jgi:hypothetical protein
MDEDILTSGPLDNPLVDLTRQSDQSDDISTVPADIAEITAIGDNLDADLAVDIAGCLQECIAGAQSCERCVDGQIDDGIRQITDILDKVDTRVDRPIQEGIANLISTGVNLGIPIAELLPGTATQDQPAEVSATAERPATVLAQIPGPTAVQAVQPMAQAEVVIPAAIPANTAPAGWTAVRWTPIPGTTGGTGIFVDQQGFGHFCWTNGQGNSSCDAGFQCDVINEIHALGLPAHRNLTDPCIVSPDQPPSGIGPPGQIEPQLPGDGLCPCPAPVGTGGSSVVPFVGVNLCDPNNVSGIKDVMDAYRVPEGFSVAVGISGAVIGAIRGLSQSIISPTGTVDPSLLVNGITGMATLLATSITYRMAKDGISGPLGRACESEASIDAQTTLGYFRFISSLPGMVPDYVKQTATYQANYLCPYLLPSAADANTLWNQGILTHEQWELLVRANGYCPQWQERIREALSPVPTIDQVVSLERRGGADRDTIKYYYDRLGVRNPADKDAFRTLSDFVPGPSDLVSFMTRDVFDPAVVDEEKLDSEFADKFQGNVEQWAAAQGMDAEQFKAYWRAHWRYPSPEQLAEFVHRLRPDDRDPDDKYKDVVFTVDDFKRLMKINDYAPEHIEEYLATTYRPLTRVDARRGFEIGSIDEDGLRRAYKDLGYAPTQAQQQVDFAKLTSGKVRAKNTGSAGTGEVLKWYRERYIDRERAEVLLIESGVPDKYINKYLSTEDQRRNADFKKSAVAAYKKRYMFGEFSTSEINSALSNVGIDPRTVGEIVFQWSTLREAKYKAPTASMLCDWWRRGLIAIEEFTRRVENLGFSHLDAQRIIQTCMGKRQEQLEKDAEKQAKEAAAKEAKRLRDLKSAQRDAEKAYKAGLPCTPTKPKCRPGTAIPAANGQAAGRAGSSPASP